MKPDETKAIYEKACRTRRFPYQQDESEAWHKSLRGFEARDVQAALDEWWASAAVDDKGEPRSKWLPTTGELRQITERIQSKRIAKKAEKKLVVDCDCPSCGVWWSAAVSVGEIKKFFCRAPKPGPQGTICGAELIADGTQPAGGRAA